MMHRNTARALVALAAALTGSSAALAQTAAEPAAASPLTANVTLTTNYKFRGQDQDTIGNNGYAKTRAVKPAIQGGFDYAHESGFYIGNWNSSVNWLAGNSIESDIYGGYKFKAGPVDIDVGALTYIYPGNTVANTTEVYGSATYADEAIGSFTLKYSHTVSKDYFGYAGEKSGSGLKGRNTGYLNLAYAKEIVPKVTLKAAVGYTRMSSDIRSLGYKSYVDYNVGAAYDFGGGLVLSGTVQGGNKKDSYLLASNPGVDFGFGTFGAQNYSVNKARFIVALTKTL
ncbi:MAG: hypothetical protein EOO24_01830 [Comamonadaceae bacterium]|nr:MAG: hypothetical protein EOO24_01830 [Comamonadaceae bacterium]